MSTRPDWVSQWVRGITVSSISLPGAGVFRAQAARAAAHSPAFLVGASIKCAMIQGRFAVHEHPFCAPKQSFRINLGTACLQTLLLKTKYLSPEL
jgi:hypothetical protein